VWRADIADGRDDLRSHAHSADGVVHGLLAVRNPEGRYLGDEPAALEIGSYQTAWAMLHRLRAVLVLPLRNVAPTDK